MNRFNLNSYFALDAILRHATLTDAARSINLSQPAMSLALKRLRETFGDELVRYERGRAELTPLAMRVRPEVTEILRRSRDVLALSRNFDPQTSQQMLTVAMPDTIQVFLMAKLTATLAIEAPGIVIEVVPFSPKAQAHPHVDLFISPLWAARQNDPLFALCEISASCMVCVDSGSVVLSDEAYLAGEHVALPDDEEALLWPEGSDARALLQRRNVTVRAPRLDALRHLVANGHLIATTLAPIAQKQAALTATVHAVSSPTALTPVTIVAQSPEHRDDEPAVRWLIDRVRAVSRALTA